MICIQRVPLAYIDSLKSVFQGQFGGKYAGFQQYALVAAAVTAKVGLVCSCVINSLY